MGFYLNSKKARSNYQEIVNSTYFVDKTLLLKELIPIVGQGNTAGKSNKYICITRPRRFGKTVMANMISAYFGKGADSHSLFNRLSISACRGYKNHLNQHNVIFITLSEVPDDCRSYEQYISRFKKKIMADLMRAFPDAEIDPSEPLWDAFNTVFERKEAKFIFVLDEWDFLFHKDFAADRGKSAYISFLSTLLKDQPYVEMAYMTGILPIAKYSSGSELNMFLEYTMASEEKYCEYFGFTEEETDRLYEKYLQQTEHPRITREELQFWYNGYHTMSGRRLYNPRSVISALINNNLGNYWTSSGPYDEIVYYIRKNVDDVRDDIALMAAGGSVPVKIREYAASSMKLDTKEEIFSAMVVYGFLSSENGRVSIPNKELMDKFDEMLLKEPSLGYVYRLAKESERMLGATLAQNIPVMLEILEHAHNTEIPLLSYNDETELTALINLVYLSARDSYRIEREDKAGIGYVDFIFYPEDKKADGIILELKIDHTPEEAIQQIKDRKYVLKFWKRLGGKETYTGRILAVGITYHKKDKVHRCKIEELYP